MTTIRSFDFVNRLNETCIELPSEQHDFINSLSGKDYSDDTLGHKRVMDELLANVMIVTAIKMKQEEVDRELLEKLGPKEFTRYKKQHALEREVCRRRNLRELTSENRAQHHPAYPRQHAGLFDLLLGVQTSKPIHALGKFAKQVMRWVRAYKL